MDSAERTKYFYHTDHLGSTILVTDTAGQTVWSAEYTPFGIVAVEEGSLRKAGKFTGKDLDEDTGLYYYNARWYDQEIGRFITEDTYQGELNDPQTLNLYAYVFNNPLVLIDPTGNNALNTQYIREYLETTSNPTAEGCRAFIDKKILEERAPTLQEVSEVGLVVVSVLYEPVDWAVTGYSWLKGDFSAWDLLNLLPLMNGPASRNFGNFVEDSASYLRQGSRVTNSAENIIEDVPRVFDSLDNVDEVIEGTTKTVDEVAEQIVNADRVGTALSKNDAGHVAASFIPEEQLVKGKIYSVTGGDGVTYTLLQTEGEVNGIKGIFEYMLSPEGTVTHQRFIKNGVFTGTPNQIVK